MHSLSQQTLIYLETKTKLSSWVRECQQVRREIRGGKRAISIPPWVACCLGEISAEEALLRTPGRQSRLHLSGLSGRLFGFQPLFLMYCCVLSRPTLTLDTPTSGHQLYARSNAREACVQWDIAFLEKTVQLLSAERWEEGCMWSMSMYGSGCICLFSKMRSL